MPRVQKILSKKVPCFDCQGKTPMQISFADYLVPARDNHYDLNKDLVGVCSDCLSKRSEFHQKNTKPVDRNNPNLLYRPI